MFFVAQNFKSCVYGEDMCVVNSIIPAMIGQKGCASTAADDTAAKAQDGNSTDNGTEASPEDKDPSATDATRIADLGTKGPAWDDDVVSTDDAVDASVAVLHWFGKRMLTMSSSCQEVL